MRKIDVAFLIAIVLFVAVPVVAISIRGLPAVFSFLAADAFYYLTVAANVHAHGVISYDQTHPANCFHPLWQVAVTAIAGLPGDTRRLLVYTFSLNVIAAVAVLFVFWRAFRRQRLRVPMALALLPCGIFGLLVDPSFHNLWAYTNGLETSVLLVGYGLLVHVLTGRIESHLRPRESLVLGAAFTLLMLARLDSVFFLPAWLLVGALNFAATRDRKSLWSHMVVLAIPSGVLAAYMWGSWRYFGGALPVSGSVKSTFPHLNVDTLSLVWGTLTGAAAPVAARVLWVPQLIIPLASAVAILVYESVRMRRAGPDGWSAIIAVSGLYVVLFHLYNLLFVSLNHQGFWYFAISMYFMYVSAVALAERHLGLASAVTRRVVNAAVLLAALAGTWHVGRLYVLDEKPYGWVADVQAAVFDARADLQRELAGRPGRIYAVDDGLFAYATGLPTINGMGLCLDAETYASSRNGTLGNRLRELGVTHVFVPRNYLPFLSGTAKGPSVRYDGLRPVSIEEITRFQDDMRWLGPLRVRKAAMSYVLFDIVADPSDPPR